MGQETWTWNFVKVFGNKNFQYLLWMLQPFMVGCNICLPMKLWNLNRKVLCLVTLNNAKFTLLTHGWLQQIVDDDRPMEIGNGTKVYKALNYFNDVQKCQTLAPCCLSNFMVAAYKQMQNIWIYPQKYQLLQWFYNHSNFPTFSAKTFPNHNYWVIC